jgi:tRNA(adenine34) deaminase
MPELAVPTIPEEGSPEFYMAEALKLARQAAALGEIPVGAVIVRDGRIIGRGFNSTETDKDPTVHAEMKAIRQAAAELGGWRLIGCDMYVTLEPCSMCAGAIVLSRIERLFIGTMDPKAGACGSLRNIPGDERLNHQPELIYGVLQTECQAILKDFFRKLRQVRKEERRSVQ